MVEGTFVRSRLLSGFHHRQLLRLLLAGDRRYVKLSYSPSARRLPALSCLRPAASARALSRSFSFSRSSIARAFCTASALAFFDRLAGPLLSSSLESFSFVATLLIAGSESEAVRCRFTSCLTLSERVSGCGHLVLSFATHSSLSSLPLLPFRLPLPLLPLCVSRVLSSNALFNCSSSSSCSLLLIVPRLLPAVDSTLALEFSRSFLDLSSLLLLTLVFRLTFDVTGR